MPTMLTWNIYHGTFGAAPPPTIAGASPMNRLAYIANIAMANGVDVVCLQEVPQADLDPGVAFGVPAAGNAFVTLGAIAGFAASYTVLQGFSEMNPVAPVATITTDGYLILYRTAAFPGGAAGLGYFSAANFVNAYGATLRPPITVNLTNAAGAVLTVMNWHAETGPGAGWSLEILNGLVGPAGGVANPVMIGGDFNVRGDFGTVFGGFANFTNWTNIVANYPGPGGGALSGLDHILTSGNSGPVLAAALNFTSDAYHYPIAATM